MNLGILAWFQIQNDYIVKELCEEREVVNSDCAGHCVLQKKMEDTQPDPVIEVESKVLVFLVPLVGDHGFAHQLEKPTSFKKYAVLEQPPYTIFQPPRA